MLKISYSWLLNAQIALTAIWISSWKIYFSSATAAWLRSSWARHDALAGRRIAVASFGTLTCRRLGSLVSGAGTIFPCCWRTSRRVLVHLDKSLSVACGVASLVSKLSHAGRRLSFEHCPMSSRHQLMGQLGQAFISSRQTALRNRAHSDKGSQAFRVGVVGAQRLEVYGIGFAVVLLCQPLLGSFTMNNSHILFGGRNRHMSLAECWLVKWKAPSCSETSPFRNLPGGGTPLQCSDWCPPRCPVPKHRTLFSRTSSYNFSASSYCPRF